MNIKNRNGLLVFFIDVTPKIIMRAKIAITRNLFLRQTAIILLIIFIS